MKTELKKMHWVKSYGINKNFHEKIAQIGHIGSHTRFDSNLARLYNIIHLTRMLTRLHITRMLTRLESNLAITQSCGISYH